MRRVSASVCLTTLAGCAQIFGIDNTSAPADVALPPMATLTVTRLSIGASLQRNPQMLGMSGSWYVEDASDPSGLRQIPGTLAGNVISADVPDGVPAMAEWTVQNPTESHRFLLAFPNRDLAIYQAAFEHPNPEPVPMGGMLSVSLTLPTGYATNELIRLYAVGPWAYRDFSAGELPAINTGATAVGPVTMEFSSAQFASTVGPIPLNKLTSADKLLALRYNGSELTAVGEFTQFDQTGGTDAVSTTLTALTAAPIDISVDPTANATRLQQTTPSNPGLALNWYLAAAPAWEIANASGIQLNAGATMMTDSKITATYANPFEGYGWKTLFVWNPSRSRTYTPPSLALPVTLYSGVQHYLQVAGAATVDVQAGMPVLVSVNDQPLTSDGLTLTIDPAKSVKLDMVADRSENTLYQYNIHELVPNPQQMTPTSLAFKVVYVAQGPNTEIRIPAGVLMAGKVYSVRAHCIKGGYPGLATGDLTDRDLPLTLGYFDSGVFTVAAP